MFLNRHRKGTKMNFCLVSVTTLFSFILSWNLIIASVNGYNGQAPHHIGDVAINCGYHGNSTALDGRHWFGDTGTRLVISMLQPNGKSRSSTADKRSPSADPIPYMTARISATQFYYAFKVNPGQKFIRLHFYPSSYRGFENSVDFFTVKAGPFTLLKNFSASLATDALGVNYLVKEYCLCVEENKYLNITFSASQSSRHRSTYAFVNGIEIISMPTGLYYTPDGDLGAHIVGQKNRFYYIDSSTALEMVQRLNIGGSSISPVEDFGMFRRWSEDANYFPESKLQSVNHLVHGIKYAGVPVFTAPLKIYHTSWKTGTNGRADKVHNFTWKIPVDLGFGYLVRLHFCDFGLGVTESGRRDFNVLINNQIAEIEADVIRLSGGTGIPIYRDYMVIMKGDKKEGKFDLFVALQSSDKLVVRLLHGLEIFKLSNLDNNLASPNHDLPKQVSRSGNPNTQNSWSVFGNKNAIATGITILLVLMNLTVFKLRQTWEDTYNEEKDTPSASNCPSCRHFSLAEIISATQNFSDACLIGKGGFGKVYKGFIYGGSGVVAVKRLKPNSKQGPQEFWAEIETLSKIRHVHLVSLIGYCNEYQEMILVYEYMPCGTLADNLYKIGRNGKDGTPLTWEQRLRICIGAARGLDYLHTGIQFGVIHRDVKDSNILLDENLVAKISDFGLSKLGKVSESQSCVSTKVKGTFGYLDPDYFMTNRPTGKTDVYAFGIVMLVVLCGRPAVDMTISGEPQSLLFLFRECMANGDIANIVDPIMQGKISSESLNEFIRSVENCLHSQPKKRPTMSQVVTSLENALDLQQGTVSSKSEDASTSFQLFKMNGLKVSPIHHESSVSSPEEGITSELIQKPELQTRPVDLQSTRKPLWIWPWGAQRKKGKRMKKGESFSEDGLTSRLTISQLQEATDNFSPKYIIMDGRSWLAYMGTTKLCGKWCVIYKFKPTVYLQEAEACCNELELLLQLRHPNLLSVIGYCYHNLTVFVVYERIGDCTSLTTLHSCLYDTDHPPLSWTDRIRICIGVAKGLDYLHNGSRWKKRIHGVLRPEGILFQCGPEGSSPQKWTPLLSAYGCSRLSTITISHSVWSSSLNTFVGDRVPWCEYLPVDCLSSGPQFTEKNDVYAFGLILLEVLFRRRPAYDGKGRMEDRDLKTWVKRGIKTKKLHQMIDSNLEGQISQTCLSEFLEIAFKCLHDQPTERPIMAHIIEILTDARLFSQVNGDAHHDLENVYQEIAGLAEDDDFINKDTLIGPR